MKDYYLSDDIFENLDFKNIFTLKLCYYV